MGRAGNVGLAVLVAASLVGFGPGAWAQPYPPGFKSDGSALFYSFFGTGLPMGAAAYVGSRDGEVDLAPVVVPIGAGYLFGPSLGHFYAGRSRRALIGIGIRGAALGVFCVGVQRQVDSDSEAPGANTLMVLSFLAGTSSMIADIVEAPKSARIHNREMGLGAPRLTPAPIGAAMAPGFRADWTF
jgi:hypothetical protein